MNQRFTIKFLLILVSLATIAVWFAASGSQKIYSEKLSAKHKLTVYSRYTSGRDDLELTVTYHYPPAIGMYDSWTIKIPKPNSPIRFSSFTDKETGIRCIYDNNHAGLLFLFSASEDDLWHTGKPRGWASSKEKWEELLHEISIRNPGIPYKTLPDVEK